MDFEINESPSSSSPPSSSSSPSLISSCTQMTTPPNPNPSLSASHKRKAGRKKFRETRHPVYWGVRRRNGNKWVCEVREPNKKSRIWLGTYPTPEMAARAHDAAVLALKGTSAAFNFPDSPLVLPLARSSSPTHIREAAAKAVEAFKPNTSSSSSSSLLLSRPSSSSPNNFCGETIRCENMNGTEENGHGRREMDCRLKINVHCVEGAELDIRYNNNDGSRTMFFDEEALYNMPGLLDSMAEGLLITPPSMKRAMDWDDIVCEIDMNLWRD